jgi:hypothetical protein
MDETMAICFRKASCVAVGAFNVYIVQPHWLASKDLLPKGLEVVIESKMDEPGFRFTSAQLKVRWFITPTRIAIETDDPAEDCGDLMARLLRWLPETPVVAIGNNANYEAKPAAGMVRGLPDYPISQTLPGDRLSQRSFHVAVQRDKCVFNLQLSLTAERIELLINSHCPIAGERGAALAQEHAKQFLEHRRMGGELARHHLKVDVDV